jgi:hypothetical protein
LGHHILNTCPAQCTQEAANADCTKTTSGCQAACRCHAATFQPRRGSRSRTNLRDLMWCTPSESGLQTRADICKRNRPRHQAGLTGAKSIRTQSCRPAGRQQDRRLTNRRKKIDACGVCIHRNYDTSRHTTSAISGHILQSLIDVQSTCTTTAIDPRETYLSLVLNWSTAARGRDGQADGDR